MKKMNRDQLVAARYPNSKIYRLSAKRKRTGVQKILKYLRFAYVDSPACITENLVDDIGWKFYFGNQSRPPNDFFPARQVSGIA